MPGGHGVQRNRHRLIGGGHQSPGGDKTASAVLQSLRQLLPLPAASPMGLRGVAVGADGTVYVADLRGRRILALAPVGARALPAAEQVPVVAR